MHIVLGVQEADGSMCGNVGLTATKVENLDFDATVMDADWPRDDGRWGVQSVAVGKLVDETSWGSAHHGARAGQGHGGQSSRFHRNGLRGVEEVL